MGNIRNLKIQENCHMRCNPETSWSHFLSHQLTFLLKSPAFRMAKDQLECCKALGIYCRVFGSSIDFSLVQFGTWCHLMLQPDPLKTSLKRSKCLHCHRRESGIEIDPGLGHKTFQAWILDHRTFFRAQKIINIYIYIYIAKFHNPLGLRGSIF